MKCIKSTINGKDVVAVHVAEDGKSLIFQLLPDVFDWYYGVIIIVLFTINLQQHRQCILICKGFPFLSLKDNIWNCCHCFQVTNRNWLKIQFPHLVSTEWEDYWEQD